MYRYNYAEFAFIIQNNSVKISKQLFIQVDVNPYLDLSEFK